MVIGYILAFVALCVIIIFHELGHFLLAKKNDILVNEFAIGLGPTIIGKQIGETKFSIKAFPLGGACVMEGEDEKSDNERSFDRKPVWGRISVVAAGPLFNFLLAFILSVIVIGSMGVAKPIVADTMPGYAAEQAGIQEGDEIIKINNKNIYFYNEISAYSLMHPGEDVDITYKRGDEISSVSLTPTLDKETNRYLYGLSGGAEQVRTGPIETIKYSALNVKFWIQYTFGSLKMLVTHKASLNDMAGPVGIVKQVGDSYSESSSQGFIYGIMALLNFAILISANLGVINLLPLPALDGGRLVFLFIEAIRRKRIIPEKEWIVHYAGIICLFAFMAFIIINDVKNIIVG